MKSQEKRGLIFTIIPLLYGILALTILILLIWFGFRISSAVTATIDFLKQYGVWVLVGIALLVFHKQLRAIMNTILKRFGVKV